MSLHAQISPEIEERLRAQKRNSTISSVVISILVIVLIALLLFLVTIPGFFIKTPTIVTYSAGLDDDDTTSKKTVQNQVQRKPTAPSTNTAKVLASSTPTATAVPVPEFEAVEPSTDFGTDDFGESWGGESADNVDFVRIPATMRKRCSKEDRLQRLKASGGTEQCEVAVNKALDWLQATQNEDGSWCTGNKVSMTGFAILTFLGRCETPLSRQYGDTVLDGVNYLISISETTKGKLADDLLNKHWPYEHAIATYALAEAYTFSKQLNINVPGLEEAVKLSGQWIIDNQHESGSWEYAYITKKGEGNRQGDNSIGAWHVQALKACKTTGIEFENIRKCANDALDFIAKCQTPDGGIGYSHRNKRKPYSSLAGAGALCFQMWEKSSDPVARKATDYVSKNVPFKWDTEDSDIYALYYNAQAMINRGGPAWTKFNADFMPSLLAGQDKNGSWKRPGPGGNGDTNGTAAKYADANSVGLHYRTCLAALTLEVYYRFLPGTGQKTR